MQMLRLSKLESQWTSLGAPTPLPAFPGASKSEKILISISEPLNVSPAPDPE